MSISATIGIDSDTRRVVPLPAIHNFRDLGGLPTSDGRITRWHRLYRSDALSRATDADLALLRPLGLRTVIDLRAHAELDQWGTFPFEACPVRFLHLPVLDATWRFDDLQPGDDARSFLRRAYLQMLRQGGPLFGQVISTLSQPGALPGVFHCAAGKDRTGLVAALVLGALNVSDEIIAEDYMLSLPALERTRVWAAAHMPELETRMASAPAAMLTVDRDAILDVLGELRADYGNIATYLVSIGVSTRDLASLTDAITSPSDGLTDLVA